MPEDPSRRTFISPPPAPPPPAIATNPADPEWVAGRVATLLAAYPMSQEQMEPELLEAVYADWIEVLDGLPQDAIHAACVDYLRTEPRWKPTPGQVYQRAKAIVEQRARLAAPAPPPDPRPPRAELTDDQIEKRRQVVAELLGGFTDAVRTREARTASEADRRRARDANARARAAARLAALRDVRQIEEDEP